MAKVKNIKCWSIYRATVIALQYWEQKIIQPLWNELWEFLGKTNIYLSCDLAIPPLVTYNR